MKIVFLGTSGSMPTPSRGASAVAVKREGEVILFDCGEGTQQRMVAARLGFRRPTRIFVSHLHGDHVLGLPGLLQTMTLLRRERPLHLYGPRGILDFIKAFSAILGAPGFPLEIHEILDGGVVYTGPDYKVEAVRADHEGECWSYALVEHPRPGRFHPERARALGVPEGPLWKRLQRGGDVVLDDGRRVRSAEVVDPPRRGRKIVYSGDTRPTEALVELARGADVLIHEATFDDALAERAAEDGHSTASQAAEVAAAARVELLLLTHVSSRYPDPAGLLEQARKVFPNTRVAEDLMEVEIPL
ncbi:ribonuclease Z [Candidatus Bathyarchaeota archaeon]|nr:MAG: ribonuclease Z [Candidatus Bathyarchaeota archaeon]